MIPVYQTPYFVLRGLYESKADATTKNLAVILEPILLVLVWLGVVGVALAVILPIYSLVGGLNQNESPTPPPVEGGVTAVSPESPQEAMPLETQSVSMENVESKIVPETVTVLLRVQKTGTGYLNVRDTPSVSGALVGKVLPGDELSSSEERDGWFSVVLPDGKTGWVSGDYVKTIRESLP